MAERFYKENRVSTKLETESFLKLPRRCQEMFFEQITREDGSGYTPFGLCGFPDYLKSPIEQMFYMAFVVINFEYYNSMFFLESQAKIYANGKKYMADFLFDSLSDEVYPSLFSNDYKLVIECDGHEFHKLTKEQVKYDNERDFNLKDCGYDVIHFSGSQIYENPWKCADEVCKYLTQKVKLKKQEV